MESLEMTDRVYSLDELRKIIYEHKEELEKDYNAVAFFIFGSYSKGLQTPESDIDLLVELKAPLGLKFFKLENFLAKLFGKKVDLGTANNLRPLIKDKILKEAVRL
jgi:uncharacterized protein